MINTQRQPRVLIVDDSARILQSIKDLLTISADYTVLSAAGGYEAMRVLNASLEDGGDQIDLILLDITMPAIDGLDVLKWLREEERFATMRVIMLTARDDKKTVVEALSIGADDYITKPFHPQELLARVSSSLRTQRLEKQLQWQQSQLNTLNRLGTRLLSIFDPTQLFETSLDGVHELLDVGAVGVYLATATRQFLRCQHLKFWGNEVDAAAFAKLETSQTGIIANAFRYAKILIANEGSDDSRFRPNADAPIEFPVESMAAAPIYTHGNVVGVLVAYNKNDGEFSETDVDLFASLAGTLSLAFENAWHLHNIERQQESLRNSRNKLQAIIDGIQTPIYTINDSWQISSLNASQSRLANQNGQSPNGRLCYEVFYNRQSPCEHCQIPALLTNQTPQHWDWAVQSDDNAALESHWEVQAYPLPQYGDRDATAVVVWQDRTEERRLERSLVQSAKLSAIGRLTAGIAHELNNPLTVISTGIEMLQIDMTPDTEDYEIITWMGNATDRVAQGVRSLLELGRQSQYEFREGDINQSLNEALELLKYQINSVNIVAEKSLAQDMPTVVASWQHLKTAWVSILLNARDALEDFEGDRKIFVTSTFIEDSSEVMVSIRDTGKGMEPEQLKHIFEPFYTTKASGKGTGLGMFTCKRIIEEHTGTISAKSRPQQGAEIVIMLPLRAG
jgi:two-component system NtrC family sensor kinase